MSSPNKPDDDWSPREWQPADWQPSDETGSTGGDPDSGSVDGGGDAQTPGAVDDTSPDSGSPWSAESAGFGDSGDADAGGIADDPGYYSTDGEPAPGGSDDYAPYGGGGFDSGGFDSAGGGYETPPPSSAPSAADPYGQPSADPYGQPSASPHGQPSADPYGQPSASPYGQPSATPYGQPSATPYGQPSATPQPADPPPAQNFPPYQAPGGAQPGPYGGQPSPYGGQPSPYGNQPAPYGGQQGGYGQSPYAGVGMTVNHPRAVPSMVCGIVGMLCCPILSVVAIVLGVTARKEISAEPNRWTGGGMALAGIILGAISAAYGVIYWVAMVIDTLAG